MQSVQRMQSVRRAHHARRFTLAAGVARAAGAIVALVAALGACHSVREKLGGDPWYHPSWVAGEWLDVQKTTAADSSFWVLGAHGSDATRRVQITADAAGRPVRRETRQKWGSWYEWTHNDTTLLCFANRAARSPARCTPFRLDSSDGGTPRRMVLYNYQGRHHLSQRVLLEWRPARE